MGWIALIGGVVLWAAAHFFKRVAPETRARMGNAGRGVVAVLLLTALAAMIYGCKNAAGPVWWGANPGAGLQAVCSLLTLAGFYLFAASAAQTRITAVVRHPQLTAMMCFALGHLLANGEAESVILFGGLLAWAAAQIALINRDEGPWTAPERAFAAPREAAAALGALIVFALAFWVHGMAGTAPFG